MALCSAGEHAPDPPRLRFSTLAGLALAGTPGTDRPAAQRAPSRISETKPPHLPRTRTGRILDVQLIPATPTPLFVTAPMVPATWVPCQLLSLTEQPTKGPPTVVLSADVTQSPGSEGSASLRSPSFATFTSLTKSKPGTVRPTRSTWFGR